MQYFVRKVGLFGEKRPRSYLCLYINTEPDMSIVRIRSRAGIVSAGDGVDTSVCTVWCVDIWLQDENST